MSSSTWWRYCVSEISTPATNAPSASESPASSVRYADASVMNSTLMMKSSCERRFATRSNHDGISFWPSQSTAPRIAAAFSAASPRAPASSPSARASAGTRTSSGTTARSCASSTPMTSRPCGVSVCIRSASMRTTIAVDDIASAAPSASAPCQRLPAAASSAAKSAVVSTTCSPPSPSTRRRICTSFGRLNSSPMVNIRNTTPNSPR